MALPTATHYLANVDADAHFATSFNNAAWTALTEPEKTLALGEATRWLEQLCWKGTKCSDTQPLQWPRKADKTSCCAAVVCTALPTQLVAATAELALALHQNKTAIINGIAAAAPTTTGAVKRQKLGDLEQEFFEPGSSSSSSSSSSRFGPSAPLVLQKFPWLSDLLGECLMAGSLGNSRIIARVRS
jgi:hypothetical protein